MIEIGNAWRLWMQSKECNGIVLGVAKGLAVCQFAWTGMLSFQINGIWPLAAMWIATLAGAFQIRILSSEKAWHFQRMSLIVEGLSGFALMFPKLPFVASIALSVLFGASLSWLFISLLAVAGTVKQNNPVFAVSGAVFGLGMFLIGISGMKEISGLPHSIIMVGTVLFPASIFGCLIYIDDYSRAAELGRTSLLNGTEAVFDGQRTLSFFSLFKMNASRFILILGLLVSAGIGMAIGGLDDVGQIPGPSVLPLAFAVGCLLFGLIGRKGNPPRAMLLAVSSALCAVASSLTWLDIDNPIFSSSIAALLGLGLGGVVCTCLGYYLLACRAMSVMVNGIETSLLSGSLGGLCIGGIAMGFAAGRLIGVSIALAMIWILASALLMLFVGSRFLSDEAHMEKYLSGEEANPVVREGLVRRMIRRPDKHKRPPILLYWLAMLVISPMCRFKFGMRVVKNCRIERPALILTNHASNFDYLFIGAACFPLRISFLATYYWFTFKKLRPWLRFMGVIQKYQFATDLTAMKKLKYVIQEKNGATFIAPEGTIYADGKSGYVGDAVVKIVKFLKVPVYTIKIEGAGLGHGKWQKVQQKDSKVLLTIDKLLDNNDVKTLPSKEIYERIVEAIKFDDFEFQKRTGVQICGARKAEGLDDLLYKCPRCQKEFVLSTRGNTISCSNCRLEAQINESFRFDWPEGKKWFDNYSEWFDYQYDSLYQQMKANPDFSMSAKVRYRVDIVDTDGYNDAGEGILTLSLKDGWTYDGMLLGRHVVEHDNLSAVPVAIMKMGCHIELPFKGHSRCFHFIEDGRYSQKWHIASRIITEKLMRH
jgi:1-acyl-sn-glycerol-3-phosphate acyltransferase/transcription elongation factor Elf1